MKNGDFFPLFNVNLPNFLLIALIFLIVSFFVALIAPKGKRKLLWLFAWFMVFFADGFITSAIFHYYGNLYGKINVYEKPAIHAYYAGEKKFDRWFPEVNQLSSQYTKVAARLVHYERKLLFPKEPDLIHEAPR